MLGHKLMDRVRAMDHGKAQSRDPHPSREPGDISPNLHETLAGLGGLGRPGGLDVAGGRELDA